MSGESDLAAHLETLLSTTAHPLTVGGGIYRNSVRKVADDGTLPDATTDKAVFITATVGPQRTRFRVGGSKTSGSFEEHPNFQLWVRSDPFKYDDGQDLLDTVKDEVDMTPPAGYFESRVLAEPAFVEQDDEGRYNWTIDVQLDRCP